MLQRHSSRRAALNTFLADALDGATGYDRIAGYFSSSVLEIAGEAIDRMDGSVRMVCNSDLDPSDVATARAAALALRREWNASLPEDFSTPLQTRLARLYALLKSGKLQVRVLPDSVHPFELRYDRIETVDWESCATPLVEAPQLDVLRQGWIAGHSPGSS